MTHTLFPRRSSKPPSSSEPPSLGEPPGLSRRCVTSSARTPVTSSSPNKLVCRGFKPINTAFFCVQGIVAEVARLREDRERTAKCQIEQSQAIHSLTPAAPLSRIDLSIG